MLSLLEGAMMDFDEYSKKAMRTSLLQGIDRLNNAALGLSGEAGEVANAIKKVEFHGHDLDREKIKEELGDVLWYIADLADYFCIPLVDIAQGNIDKLLKRYPNGFSHEASRNRVDVHDGQYWDEIDDIIEVQREAICGQ